jgi:catechol 2,3-dioxygenase-like lactoylglutathione lyase family enzyme
MSEPTHVPEGEYPPPPDDLQHRTDAGNGGAATPIRSGLDHVDIRVSDVEQSLRFYEAALAPLGWHALPREADPTGAAEVGFGHGEGTEFAIHATSASPGQDTVTTGAHIAFTAGSREAVHAFHSAAVAHGGRDIGAPGPRTVYSAGYYGGFVLDPDGNNIEAVWHDPAEAS